MLDVAGFTATRLDVWLTCSLLLPLSSFLNPANRNPPTPFRPLLLHYQADQAHPSPPRCPRGSRPVCPSRQRRLLPRPPRRAQIHHQGRQARRDRRQRRGRHLVRRPSPRSQDQAEAAGDRHRFRAALGTGFVLRRPSLSSSSLALRKADPLFSRFNDL